VPITGDALNLFHAMREQVCQEGSPMDFRYAQSAADSRNSSMAI